MNKLNKKNLLRFLTKINLNGMANKMLILNDSKKSSVNGLDDSANLMIIGSIKGNLFEKDEEVGIYDVKSFMRYINLFEKDELQYKFEKNSAGVNAKLLISDSNKNLSYNLADKDNIPSSELKKLPDSNYVFEFDEIQIKDILKSVEVSISKFISFVKVKSNLYLYIGEESSGEHIIKIKLKDVEIKKEADVDRITFNKDYFVNILKLNNSVKFELMNGLLIYNTEADDVKVNYYQRSLVSED